MKLRTQAPPELDRVLRLLDLQVALHRPRFTGWENLPDERPLLFVGNHTLMGVIDTPLFFRELWVRKGIFLNSLGDRAHFHIPGWRRLLRRYGAVEGTRANLAELFASGAAVLVFPGGSREVFKRRGEEHRLLWGDRLGFAEMALEHRVTIVPFAAVGVEEALDIVLDRDELSAGPLGPLLDAVGLRDDLRPTLVRGIGPTPIPRPERFDFHFCPVVRTDGYAATDGSAAEDVRDRVAAAIEAAVASLLAERAARSPARR